MHYDVLLNNVDQRQAMTNKQRGVTLLEVLIAFLLVGFAGLSLIKLQLMIEQKSSFAQQSYQALMLAENKLEWFITRGAINHGSNIMMVDFDVDIKNGQDNSDSVYTVSWNVINIEHSLKQVEVESYWYDHYGIRRSVKLQTMISRFSEFGMTHN